MGNCSEQAGNPREQDRQPGLVAEQILGQADNLPAGVRSHLVVDIHLLAEAHIRRVEGNWKVGSPG